VEYRVKVPGGVGACTLLGGVTGRLLTVLQVPSEQLTWARIFGTMERAKLQYDIEDYSVSQTSLEQVFISFARAQHPDREVELTCGARCALYCRHCCFERRRGRRHCCACVRTETL